MRDDRHNLIRRWRKRIAAVALIGFASCAGRAVAGDSQPLDFTRDVRPILADNCFHCHGNDDAHREADLRLDLWTTSGEGHAAEHVISPGKPAESELVARIASDDPDVRMPPPDSGKSLQPEQIATLRRWIADGAVFKTHWAFEPPQRPAVPVVSDTPWVKNPIDSFVVARLEQAGLKPSQPAAPETLLRRLSLDLIGLPPSLDEVAEFSAEMARSPANAYEHAIDRLLNSQHFGERWGRIWLDAARYADSDGFEKDKPREVWMYRDWVIKALNSDMPYDEFLVKQIAGDLLPEPTQDDMVATGFLRNSMVNEEGGIDPEQFRMEAMYDRMDAIGKAVLGITVQCAQCHSHKYDPLTHTEYYRMFAFLNNCNEEQVAVYTHAEHARWQAAKEIILRIEDGLRAENPDWPARMAAWEETVRNDQPEWTVASPKEDSFGGQKHYVLKDGSVLAAGYAPTIHTTEFTADVPLPKVTAIRLELLNDPSLPRRGPGRSIYGTCALTEFEVEAAPLNNRTETSKVKFSQATSDVYPATLPLEKMFDDLSGNKRVTGPVELANDGDEFTAWGIDIGAECSNVPREAVFVCDKPLEVAAGVELKFKLVQKHGGWNGDENQTNNLGRFRFSVTSAENAVADPIPSAVREILDVPASKRTPEQTATVFSHWRTTVSAWREANRQIEALWQSHPRGTTQLAVTERADPRATHRLERGNFLAPAEEVSPGVPAFLHPLETSTPSNRLSFARWLADRRSPTTARAIVNRVWQSYFGTGLVATAEDLGTQGDPPTHPELLDWLAAEFMDHGWSLKHLHRLIVTSATYQQSSTVTPELLERDPANHLLARGPRFRVDAEVVRDIALSASGLLNGKIGGPSVYPPAPAFLFQPPSSYGPKTWIDESGPNRYRRALYTFRFRSIPYPALQSFDAPTGDVACARRVRSNTPLQALTTLNEGLYLECARALAAKIVLDGGSSDSDRIAYAVRSCLAREPQERELHMLREFVGRQKERFGKPGADPAALVFPDGKPPATADSGNTSPADLAAWTALARVVLNLDETITKE